MGEIGFLLAAWDKRNRWVGWYRGGMEGPGSISLALEVRWAAESGRCHHFHWYFRGRGVFDSLQKNNYNTLHTNPNYNIVQDSKNITYDIIVLWTTTNCTNNENIPRKKSRKIDDIKIEDSQPYIAELVKNIPKYWVSGKKLQANFCWGVCFWLCKYLINEDKNYITMVKIKTAIIPFVLIPLAVYIALGLVV